MAAGLSLMSSLVAIAQARWLSQIIGQIFLQHRQFEQVSRSVWMLFGLIILRTGLSWSAELASTGLAVRIKTRLRQTLYQHLSHLSPVQLRQESTGEITHTLIEGIDAIEPYFSQYLPQLILAICVPLAILSIVFPLDVLTGTIFLITAPLIPLFMLLIGGVANALTQQQWRVLSRLSGYFLDVIQGLTTLKTLGRSREQAATLDRANEQYRQSTLQVLRVSFLSSLSLEMLSTLSTAIIAVEIGLRLLSGKMTFEPAFFILVIAPEFYLPLRQLGARFHAGMAGTAASQRFFALLDIQPSIREPLSSKAPASHPKPPEISFEDVHFTYPDGRKALDGVSFTLPGGKVTALVGESGAGKSTIANLLLGFCSPSQGKITFHRHSPFEPGSGSGKPQIAWVPQTPFLFNDTVSANIRLGAPAASIEIVKAAARLAHADTFIEALPQGYETLIGERGQRLSNGEAQRTALARAFLLDAPFLILDEPTSSLDPITESAVLEATRRLAEGRTVLVVAHRMNTTTQADQVIVLNQGRVVECGSHLELMQKNGKYASMVKHRDFHPSLFHPPGEVRKPPSHLSPITRGEENLFSASYPKSPGTLSSFHTFWRLMTLLKPYRYLVILSVILGFFTVGSSIGLMSTSAYIISFAALQPSIADLQVAIVGVRFFGITRGVFRYLERLVTHETTFLLLARLRAWFYQALEPLAPAVLFGFHSGDILNRINHDLVSLESFFVRAVAPPSVALLDTLFTSLFLAFFNPGLGIFLMILFLFAGIGVPLLAYWLGRTPGNILVKLRAELSALLVDGIQGMADLKAFRQSNHHTKRVVRVSEELAAVQKRFALIQSLGHSLETGLAYTGMWGVLVLSILLIQTGQVPALALGTVVLAALTSFEAIQPLPEASQQLENNLAAAKRLFEIVDHPSLVKDQPVTIAPPEHFTLRCEDLSFQYPDNPGFHLAGITFDLPEGKHLALVGPSGSGKSTLISLLLRFWDYQTGSLQLNGQEIKNFQSDALRKVYGVVWQRTHLFNATLRENLVLAAPNATQAEVDQICEQVQLGDLVASLPQGYDTWVGEGGLLLSPGERQRLAIGRALLKKSSLVLLDEPTAHLDVRIESVLMQNLQANLAGRSLLLVTHRLVGLEDFDEILVLQDGSISERGRHADLIARRGVYWQLWQAQSQYMV